MSLTDEIPPTEATQTIQRALDSALDDLLFAADWRTAEAIRELTERVKALQDAVALLDAPRQAENKARRHWAFTVARMRAGRGAL